MSGAFIAATVVALAQYVRSPDRRLVPLMAALLLVAFLLEQGAWTPGSQILPTLLCLAGLTLALRPSLLPSMGRGAQR